MQVEEKSSVQLTLPYTIMDSYKHFKFFYQSQYQSQLLTHH